MPKPHLEGNSYTDLQVYLVASLQSVIELIIIALTIQSSDSDGGFLTDGDLTRKLDP